jgi:SAM-dependent methyltransferase
MESLVQPHWRVLDLGAGAGECNPYHIKGRVLEMVGVDFDPRVAQNPLLDRGIPVEGPGLPFADETFDLVFSVYVWEHVQDPQSFLREAQRVLRPGGVLAGLTPNRFHYVPLIASLTPHWFHEKFNAMRGRAAKDTFPTCYRLNDRATVKREALRAGLEQVEIEMVECRPNYLAFSLPTFLVGALYERLVNGIPWLQGWRVNLICTARKPGSR